jgi:hypothetical protein
MPKIKDRHVARDGAMMLWSLLLHQEAIMSMNVQKVQYFVMHVANRTGEAARVLDTLKAQKVNLLAFTGFPEGRSAQMDFVPERSTPFLRATRKAKLKVSAKKAGFLIRGTDAPGAVANVMDKLAAAKINVTAVDAVNAGNGRYGAMLWVKQKDVSRAAKMLHAK